MRGRFHAWPAASLTVFVAAFAGSAVAEPLPSGAIGLESGGVSGTGADAKRVGAGYYQFGAQASWQPTTTEKRWGWSLRWTALFGAMYGGSANRIDTSLHTVEMDLTLGVRVRPWSSPHRYLTFRAGGELMRSNQPIPTDDVMPGHREFLGAIGSIGHDWYIGGLLLNVDVRYTFAGTGPNDLALLVGVAFAGP